MAQVASKIVPVVHFFSMTTRKRSPPGPPGSLVDRESEIFAALLLHGIRETERRFGTTRTSIQRQLKRRGAVLERQERRRLVFNGEVQPWGPWFDPDAPREPPAPGSDNERILEAWACNLGEASGREVSAG